MDINNILISTSLSTAIFIIYKIINNYRLHSTCNENNQLVISLDAPIQPHNNEQVIINIQPEPNENKQ